MLKTARSVVKKNAGNGITRKSEALRVLGNPKDFRDEPKGSNPLQLTLQGQSPRMYAGNGI